MDALRSWFALSDDDTSISVCLDSIRSRAYFMKVLTPNQRKDFLSQSLVRLSALLRECRKTVNAYRKIGDGFSEAAMRGAVMETQARIRWVRMMIAAESQG